MNYTFAYSGLEEHCLFVSTSGALHSWGNNSKNALGLGFDIKASYDPQENILVLPGELKQVACGEHHSSALLKDGRLFSWGTSSQLGREQDKDGSYPREVPLPVSPSSGKKEEFALIRAGASFSAALTRDGKVYTWGACDIQLTDSPKLVTCSEPLVDLACGWGHLVGLSKNGTAYTWGGITPEGVDRGREEVSAFDLPPIRAIACGNNFSVFLTKSGTLLVHGSNQYATNPEDHNLSTNSMPPRKVRIPENLKAVAVAAGGNHVLALLEDGRVVGWGWNIYGQIGMGNSDQPSHPLCFIWPEVEMVEGPTIQGEKEAGRSEIVKGARRKKVSGLDLEIAGLGCGWGFSWLITRDGSLHLWGSPHRGAFEDAQTRGGHCRPSKVPWLKVVLPPPLTQETWESVFFWLFMGRLDERSEFSRLPVEVVWHMVKTEYQQ
jgi:alpha-tubulin suppressor-like RCC1 family protein